jgi:hypothetical protein
MGPNFFLKFGKFGEEVAKKLWKNVATVRFIKKVGKETKLFRYEHATDILNFFGLSINISLYEYIL